ncbi:hypothetical protein OG429_36040 [Streptomyces sp. NBC_00190]|uniref:hypothetical protein n=1 Tax=unclassified Streptomyces TaxID=2593676 RepID=UPI002E2D0AFA|nr:hypothetical protein [Streptomyces sp. NBC_00190]WSZ44206.1 hypothetical protein OG239_38505 [Streptomyces sp. NBC_00868]
MSDDAQQRKARADRIRQKIHRPGADAPGPAPAADEPPEGESPKEGVERRMRELDEAEGDEHAPSSGDDGEAPGGS